MTIDIAPSPWARQIYGMMVVRADDDMHMSLAQSIELTVTLQRRGHDIYENQAVSELREAAWIAPHNDGGWLIDP